MSMLKSRESLGSHSFYGFNIALLGKHCWKFLSNPDLLVTRVYKARYFSDTHFLRATKGQESSSIWLAIWTVKKTLYKGFRWKIGDGIIAARDLWLRQKRDFCVNQGHIYEGGDEQVSNLFIPNSKQWDTHRVYKQFNEEDVKAYIEHMC